jgi:putative hemin transport protein
MSGWCWASRLICGCFSIIGNYAFAVSEDNRSGLRHSLHFFDSDGSAVHKIYLTEHSDRRAYDALIAAWRSSDQSPQQPVLGHPPLASPRPDHSIDVEGFRAHWRALRDTHDFHYLLKAFGVTRTQGLRLGGTEFARSVATDAAPTLLHAIAEQSLDLMVFVSNPGVVQIHTGPVKNLKATGAWFNVLDDDFNLHLRQEDVASAWVVTKPTVDGPVTSLELYDSAGNAIAWFLRQAQARSAGKSGLASAGDDAPNSGANVMRTFASGSKTVRGEPVEPRFLPMNALRPLILPKHQGERIERKSWS